MTKSKSEMGRPPFDEKLAASYVEKYILIGLTYLDHKGKELRRQQMHGVITSATTKGIEIALRGVYDGQSLNMPPDLRAIRPAKAGTYKVVRPKEVGPRQVIGFIS